MEETWTYQKFRKAFEGSKIVRKRKLIRARREFIVGMHTTMLQNISAFFITLTTVNHKPEVLRESVCAYMLK
jgi:hypothetical protein